MCRKNISAFPTKFQDVNDFFPVHPVDICPIGNIPIETFINNVINVYYAGF